MQRVRTRAALVAYLFILPALIAVIVFSLVPIAASLTLSLFKWDLIAPSPTFIGIRNYQRLFASDEFRQVVQNTLIYTAGTVCGLVSLSLGLALLLDVRLRGIAFFRALFFIPHLTPLVSVAVLWLFLYEPERGLINAVLGQLGLPKPLWFSTTTWSLPALIIMKVWKSVGYFAILFLAGLQNIAPDLYDAARVDGANDWQRIWYVTLPLLSPTTLFVMVIAVIGAFQEFDQVAVMTGGGPANSTNVLVYYLYEQAFVNYQFGMGAAIAVIMLVVLLTFTVGQLWLSRRWVNY